jgi:hypothetical protein
MDIGGLVNVDGCVKFKAVKKELFSLRFGRYAPEKPREADLNYPEFAGKGFDFYINIPYQIQKVDDSLYYLNIQRPSYPIDQNTVAPLYYLVFDTPVSLYTVFADGEFFRPPSAATNGEISLFYYDSRRNTLVIAGEKSPTRQRIVSPTPVSSTIWVFSAFQYNARNNVTRIEVRFDFRAGSLRPAGLP